MSSLPLPWTIGSSWAPEESFDFSLDPSGEWFDRALESNVEDLVDHAPIPKAKKKRSAVSVRLFLYFAMLPWIF